MFRRFHLTKDDGNPLVQLYELVKSFLGNNDCIKCLQDGDDFLLTSCAAHLLQDLDVSALEIYIHVEIVSLMSVDDTWKQHPFFHLLNASVQKHHDVYRSATTTMLFLTARLYQVALELQQKGIPTASMISGLQTAILKCISHLDTVAVDTILNHDDQFFTTPDGKSNKNGPEHLHTFSEFSKVHSCGKKHVDTDTDETKSCSNMSARHKVAISYEDASHHKLDHHQMQNPPTCERLTKSAVEESHSSQDLGHHSNYDAQIISDQDIFDALEVEFKPSCPSEADVENTVLLGNSQSLNMVSDGGDESEDISWYFDDGVIPDAPDLDIGIKEALSEMTTILERKFNGNSNQIMTRNLQRPFDDGLENRKLGINLDTGSTRETCMLPVDDRFNNFAKGKVEQNSLSKLQKNECIPSLCDNVSTDDEFDSCFEEVECQEDAGNNENGVVVNSLNLAQNCDDEFDDCFVDTQLRDPLTGNTDSLKSFQGLVESDSMKADFELSCGKVTSCGALCRNPLTRHSQSQEFVDGDVSQNELVTSQSEAASACARPAVHTLVNTCDDAALIGLDFENKLNEIIDKNKKKVGARVLNRSRYFKTVESTVEELNNCDHRNMSVDDEVAITKEKDSDQKCLACDKFSDSNDTQVAAVAFGLEKQSNFSMIFEKLVSQKNKNPGDKILNRSRHFRTIDSSIAELKQGNTFEPEIVSDSVNDINDGSQAAGDPYNHSTDMGDAWPHSMSMETTQEVHNDIIPKEPNARPVLSQSTHSDHTSGCFSGGNSASCSDTGWQSLVYGLCQGCRDVAPLVLEVTLTQTKECCDDLLLANIHSLCVTGPLWHRSCVVSGAVTTASQEQLYLVEKHKNKKWDVLLLYGDLTFNYRHVGYIAPKNVQVTKKVLTEDDRLERWTSNVIAIISELRVDAVLVRGKVESSLVDTCLGHQVSVVGGVPARVLSSLAECGAVELNNYIVDALECDVLHSVGLSPWQTDWQDRCCDEQAFLKIEPPGAVMQTAVLCHPSGQLAHIREDQFWHAIYSVHHTLQSRHLVPGGGTTEAACVRKLKQWADEMLSSDCDMFHAEVYSNIADVFQVYVDTIQHNQSHITADCDISSAPYENYSTPTMIDRKQMSSGEGKENYWNDRQGKLSFGIPFTVYDAYSPKVEAWKNAVNVVSLLIKTDSEIITGLRGKRNESDYDTVL